MATRPLFHLRQRRFICNVQKPWMREGTEPHRATRCLCAMWFKYELLRGLILFLREKKFHGPIHYNTCFIVSCYIVTNVSLHESLSGACQPDPQFAFKL